MEKIYATIQVSDNVNPTSASTISITATTSSFLESTEPEDPFFRIEPLPFQRRLKKEPIKKRSQSAA